MTEFNLSEKMFFIASEGVRMILVEDVKEFIRRLKERILRIHCSTCYKRLSEDIDKLAGEELVK